MSSQTYYSQLCYQSGFQIKNGRKHFHENYMIENPYGLVIWE